MTDGWTLDGLMAAALLLAARLEAVEDAINDGLPTAGEGI